MLVGDATVAGGWRVDHDVLIGDVVITSDCSASLGAAYVSTCF